MTAWFVRGAAAGLVLAGWVSCWLFTLWAAGILAYMVFSFVRESRRVAR